MRILTRLSEQSLSWLHLSLHADRMIATCTKLDKTIIGEPPYKVLFYGTDEFAKCCLQHLKKNSERIERQCVKAIEVVCLPNQRNESFAVEKYARQKKLPIHLWKSPMLLDSFDIGVVVSFGKLIPLSVIQSFRYGMINVHGSLLPDLRGAAPIERAVERGYKTTGITIIKVEPGKFDHGQILARSETVEIGNQCMAKELRQKLATIGAKMCLEVLHELPARLSNASKQDNFHATTALKINKQKDTTINFSEMTAETIWNKFRAFGNQELYHLQCLYNNQLIKLAEVSLPSIRNLRLQIPSHTMPGQAFYHKRLNAVLILCKDGVIACTSFKYGKRTISAKDFNNGHMQGQIKRGEVPIFCSLLIES